jgi:hypothetical protein
LQLSLHVMPIHGPIYYHCVAIGMEKTNNCTWH